jgi:virginiamycin B lyase
MAAGVNGEVWFTNMTRSSGAVGRITPDGTISVIPLPSGVVTDYGIAASPDGNVWFTETGINKIGCLTPAGKVTEYPIPTEGSDPRAIAVAADGSIWFTERWGGKIGRIIP